MGTRARPRSRVPLALVPWLVYVAVTVVAPAANGAAGGEGYIEHAVITLGVSGAILMLWLAAGRMRPAAGNPAATLRGGRREPHDRSEAASRYVTSGARHRS